MTSSARVLLLGFGAIGRHVAGLLAPEVEAGQLALSAAVRDVAAHGERPVPGVTLVEWNSAVEGLGVAGEYDLVVECAGVPVARDLGPDVVSAGIDLVLTSVGALADPAAAAGMPAGPGRLHVTNGAIGGFDALGAAADAGGLDSVSIRTTKLASTLVRPWMDEAEAERLRSLRPGEDPVAVFSGDPAGAIEKFPANVNVSIALAWATRGRSAVEDDALLLRRSLDRVQVELVADPAAELSRHEITASGPAGRIELQFESAPSPENPKTSGMTALSVARTVRLALGV